MTKPCNVNLPSDTINFALNLATSDEDKEEIRNRKSRILALKKQYEERQRAAYSKILAKEIYVDQA